MHFSTTEALKSESFKQLQLRCYLDYSALLEFLEFISTVKMFPLVLIFWQIIFICFLSIPQRVMIQFLAAVDEMTVFRFHNGVA